MVLIKCGIFLLCRVEFSVAQIQPLDSANDYFYEGEALVQFANPSQEDVFREHQKFSVLCGMDAMKVVLPSGLDSEVTVVGSMGIFPLLEDLEFCGYLWTKEQQENVLHVSFSGCHVTTEEGRYTLKVLYNNNRDPAEVATVSCDTSCGLAASQSHRFRRSNQPFKFTLCSTEVCLPSDTPCRETCFDSKGSPFSVHAYKRYPEGIGKALYREQFDFNAEPPWDPS
ncbi:uncharacterized protein LOC134301455 [Trichomycterus rosablanca]|uniref:uncharacterized protein LOC134301455 n=1 Tax=Trichomycterus rosablanca TaxID=2290929 RepID=UPI002F35D9EE